MAHPGLNGRPSARGAALALLVLALSPALALGDEASPGEVCTLHLGLPPGAAAVMPGGARRDGRLSFPLPRSAPSREVHAVVAGARPRGPAIDEEGRLFVGTGAGLAVVSPDGASVHDVPLDVVDCAPVLVPGGGVVAISRDGLIARVDASGRVVRRSVLRRAVRFSPLAMDDGSLGAVAAGRTLLRIGDDLSVREAREMPDGLALSPTAAPSGHWLVSAGTELEVVDRATLEVLRSIPLPARAATPAAIAPDGTVWVGTVEGDLVRIRGEARVASTIDLGARLPEATTSDRAMLAIAPDGDLLVALPTRGLVRVSPEGEERWAYATETPLASAVSVDGEGRAAVIDRLGHLMVVDPAGQVEWTYALASVPLGPVLVTAQGRVVVATEGGVVILGPG